MKNSVFLVLFSIFIQACSTEVSDQIEGVKWTDNYSKLGNSPAYTSFKDGKVFSCVKKENQWQTITRYEISGNKLAILPEAKDTAKKLFEIDVTGSGENRVLTMTSGSGDKKHVMEFPISTSSDCPIN